MKKVIWLFILFLSFPLFACQVHDDTGQLLKLNKPAHRIISLAPALTEQLFAAGAGKYIIGTSSGSDYPKEAKQISIVASYDNIDVEKIVKLHPDLIIAWKEGNPINQLQALKQFHIPIFYSDIKTIPGIAENLKKLGCLAGTQKQANLAANNFMKKFHKIKTKFKSNKHIKVFYEIWPEPLQTVNNKQLISQAISACGGKNVFGNLSEIAPTVDIENVIDRSPDVIVNGTNQEGWQRNWMRWQSIPAVKNKRLYSIAPSLLERPTPRFLHGVALLCQDLA